MPADTVCVGVVVAAHGVRGQVKVRSFTEDPLKLGAYGPVTDESGARRFTVKVQGAPKDGVVIATLSGLADRDAAEALRRTRLYVPRTALPAVADDEFYHADLVGLAARTADGTELGQVLAVRNFGGGDLLEIEPVAKGETLLVPFSKAAVPVVDLAAGRLVVDPGAALPPEGPAGEEEA